MLAKPAGEELELGAGGGLVKNLVQELHAGRRVVELTDELRGDDGPRALGVDETLGGWDAGVARLVIRDRRGGDEVVGVLAEVVRQVGDERLELRVIDGERRVADDDRLLEWDRPSCGLEDVETPLRFG